MLPLSAVGADRIGRERSAPLHSGAELRLQCLFRGATAPETSLRYPVIHFSSVIFETARETRGSLQSSKFFVDRTASRSRQADDLRKRRTTSKRGTGEREPLLRVSLPRSFDRHPLFSRRPSLAHRSPIARPSVVPVSPRSHAFSCTRQASTASFSTFSHPVRGDRVHGSPRKSGRARRREDRRAIVTKNLAL